MIERIGIIQIGNTNYDWNEFQKKTEYKGEYHANRPVMYVENKKSKEHFGDRFVF